MLIAMLLSVSVAFMQEATPEATPEPFPAILHARSAGGNVGAGRLHSGDLQGLPAPVLAGSKAGAEQAAEDCGVTITFEGPETEAMVDKQMEMLQTALDKHPHAMAFAALDSQAAIPLLEQAQDEGIPVIGFNSGVDSDIPVTTAATDNVAAAALAADKMAELIGGSGEVAIIAHDQTSRTGIDRVAGFTQRMEEAYPDITIVDTQYGAGDQLKSTDLPRRSSWRTRTSRASSARTKARSSACSTA